MQTGEAGQGGVMALSSGYLWTSVFHVQALEVLAWDKDAGLQEVSSTGWFESSALAGRGRLISVTSALFLVSVPKPGHVFAAQYIRKTRLKEMQEISLCISPVVVLTVFSWKCPSHTFTIAQSSSLASSNHWGGRDPARLFSPLRGIWDVAEQAGSRTK